PAPGGSTTPPPAPGGSTWRANLDHVAVGILDPELRVAEGEIPDAARVERPLHGIEVLDLEREVRARGIDPVEGLRLLDQVHLGAADVVPGSGHAEVGPRGEPEAEQALVERARAAEIADPDRGVVQPRDAHVAHVISTSSTRKVRAGPMPNHDPIHAIQYFRASSSRTCASSAGSVMDRAFPRTRSPSTSSVTSGVFAAFRTQSRLVSSVPR